MEQPGSFRPWVDLVVGRFRQFFEWVVSVNFWCWVGPDSSSGGAAASRAEGRRFKNPPRQTKGVKNGTSGYLALSSALLSKHWLSSHSLLTLPTLHTQNKTKKK